MRRIFRIIPIMVIALVLTCSLFFSALCEQNTWDCPECGRTGNKGNYCGGCAYPAPWIERSQAQEAEKNTSFVYELLPDGTAMITGYTGEENDLIIPSALDGHVVTHIGERAFIKSYKTHSNSNGVLADGLVVMPYDLTSVILPDSVVSIGKAAFADSKTLHSVKLPSGLLSIGEDAFWGCTGLTDITLPDSLSTLGEGAFTRCESLASINLPDSLTEIGSRAFFYCESLNNVILPNSITEIGDDVFAFCQSLTTIEIPKSINCIGPSAFVGCYSLTEIEIPESVISIGESAFRGCKNLTVLDLPNSVTTIGDYAFSMCPLLTNIAIPASVTSIGKNIFEESSEVTVSVSAGSFAEQFCKANNIPIKYQCDVYLQTTKLF